MAGRRLNDTILDATGRVLRLQYAARAWWPTSALRDPIRFVDPPARGTNTTHAKVPPVSIGELVLQMVRIRGNHWVLICSDRQEPAPGAVLVWDSLYDKEPRAQDSDTSLTVHLRTLLLQEPDRLAKVRYERPQRQDGFDDCGCFVIAWAVLWCEGTDPRSVRLRQEHLREWILQCLRNQRFTSPPRCL